MQDSRYGSLIQPDAKIHRSYFNEMVKLYGIQCIYRAPRKDKSYTIHGELFSNFQEPDVVGCIFDEHPNQRTMRKLGWYTEALENASVINVPYDLHDLQKGALFIIPSAIDGAQGRVFKVYELSTTMIYPASIACAIVPEYEDTMPNSKLNREHQDFAVLAKDDKDDTF